MKIMFCVYENRTSNHPDLAYNGINKLKCFNDILLANNYCASLNGNRSGEFTIKNSDDNFILIKVSYYVHKFIDEY